MNPAIACALLFLSLVIAPLRAEGAPASSSYEVASPRKAAAFLPRTLRSGPHYQLKDPVTSNGYFNIYRVSSNYGEYRVVRTWELKKLVHEIAALDELQEITDSKAFARAAKEAGIDLATAPVRGITSFAETISDTEKLKKTAQDIPQGMVGFFGYLGRKIDSGIKTVEDALSDEEPASRLAHEAGTHSTSAALHYAGYNRRANEWYEKLGVDPYTTNAPLREKSASHRLHRNRRSYGF